MGTEISAYDPGADKEEFKAEAGFDLSPDIHSAIRGCQGVIMITDWPEFKELDFRGWKELMSAPYLFFDTRNFFRENEVKITQSGLKYKGLGK